MKVATAGAGVGSTWSGSVVDVDAHERTNRDDGPRGPIPLGP
jgi:hypothetical protein